MYNTSEQKKITRILEKDVYKVITFKKFTSRTISNNIQKKLYNNILEVNRN